jgi:hypothetical protein
MRKIAISIPVIAAALMLYAAPVLSDEWSPAGVQEETGPVKDECLLTAMNCTGSADSIQQRIDKLQKEIARGSDVYTPDELRILNQKLDDANKVFNELMNDRPEMGS